MRCANVLAALLICLTAATASAYTLDCGPEQLEVEFQITALENNTLSSGIGRFHIDSKVSNVTVMNVTWISKFAAETALYITDLNTNLVYQLNPSTGQCSVEKDSFDSDYVFISTVYLGSGLEKLEVNIFESNSRLQKTTLVATKNLCIPVQAMCRSDSSIKIINFFNATIGIKNPDVLRIPDKCRAL